MAAASTSFASISESGPEFTPILIIPGRTLEGGIPSLNSFTQRAANCWAVSAWANFGTYFPWAAPYKPVLVTICKVLACDSRRTVHERIATCGLHLLQIGKGFQENFAGVVSAWPYSLGADKIHHDVLVDEGSAQPFGSD